MAGLGKTGVREVFASPHVSSPIPRPRKEPEDKAIVILAATDNSAEHTLGEGECREDLNNSYPARMCKG